MKEHLIGYTCLVCWNHNQRGDGCGSKLSSASMLHLDEQHVIFLIASLNPYVNRELLKGSDIILSCHMDDNPICSRILVICSGIIRQSAWLQEHRTQMLYV